MSFSTSDIADDADSTGDAARRLGHVELDAGRARLERRRPDRRHRHRPQLGHGALARDREPERDQPCGHQRAQRQLPGRQRRTRPVWPPRPSWCPQLTIVKSSPITATVPGARVTFTLTITNSGQTAYTGIEVRDNLAGALDDATYESAVIVSGGGTLTYTAPELVWTGDLAVGAVVTITYALIVNSPDNGDKNLVDVVTSTAPGSSCVAGPPAPGCRLSIIVLTPGLTIVKTANAAVTTMGGDRPVHRSRSRTRARRRTRRRSSPTHSPGCSTTPPTTRATADRGSVTLESGTRCAGPGDLATGETATVTYSVTVDLTDGDKVLANQVTSAAAGNNCPTGTTDPQCQASVRGGDAHHRTARSSRTGPFPTGVVRLLNDASPTRARSPTPAWWSSRTSPAFSTTRPPSGVVRRVRR